MVHAANEQEETNDQGNGTGSDEECDSGITSPASGHVRVTMDPVFDDEMHMDESGAIVWVCLLP